MVAGATRSLTERQREVMRRIDRRMPIKLIASELGISATRVNQHIRALKDHYKAENLNELVEKHRRSNASSSPLRKDVWDKNQVPRPAFFVDQPARTDPGEILLSEARPVGDFTDAGLVIRPEDVTRPRREEPRIVPGVLDGRYAIQFRLLTVVGISLMLMAAVILSIAVAQAVSEVIAGQASVPVAEQAPAG